MYSYLSGHATAQFGAVSNRQVHCNKCRAILLFISRPTVLFVSFRFVSFRLSFSFFLCCFFPSFLPSSSSSVCVCVCVCLCACFLLAHTYITYAYSPSAHWPAVGEPASISRAAELLTGEFADRLANGLAERLMNSQTGWRIDWPND